MRFGENDGLGEAIKVEDAVLDGSPMTMIDVVVGFLTAVPVGETRWFGSGSVATVEDTTAFATVVGALATSPAGSRVVGRRRLTGSDRPMFVKKTGVLAPRTGPSPLRFRDGFMSRWIRWRTR
jgi:hypothetical protein